MKTFRQNNPTFLGVFYLLLSVFLFSSVNIVVKDTGSHYPVTQVLLFRFAFALIPMIWVMRKNFTLAQLIPHHLKYSLLSGIIMAGGVGCLFLSVIHLPLADAQAISFSSSLFVTALALPVLGEAVGLHRWVSVGVGFIGVLIVVNPSTDVVNVGGLYGLIFSLCQAFLILFSRIIVQKDSPAVVTLFTVFVATLLVLPFGVFYWEPIPLKDFCLLVFLGVGCGVAQYYIISAYKYAEASLLSPFLYSALIWGILFDLALWGHPPNINMLVGAGIIIASSLYIVIRERKQASPNEEKVL